MSNVNRRRGKRFERKIAEKFNGMRVGLLGNMDVVTQRFAIECKSRDKLPRFLVKAWLQANNNAGGKLPVLCLHETNKPHEQDMLVMRVDDFLRLMEDLDANVRL